MKTKKTKAKDFDVYAIGMCYASVCTSLSKVEAGRRLNVLHPTGLATPWKPSKDKEFASGGPNPCPCEDKPETHKHYLFEC